MRKEAKCCHRKHEPQGVTRGGGIKGSTRISLERARFLYTRALVTGRKGPDLGLWEEHSSPSFNTFYRLLFLDRLIKQNVLNFSSVWTAKVSSNLHSKLRNPQICLSINNLQILLHFLFWKTTSRSSLIVFIWHSTHRVRKKTSENDLRSQEHKERADAVCLSHQIMKKFLPLGWRCA